MAFPRLAKRRTNRSDDMRPKSDDESGIVIKDEPVTTRQSGVVRTTLLDYRPKSMRRVTMDVVAAVYEDSYGYPFDFDRIAQSFGHDRESFPRRLAGSLLIELSKHLHPGRRTEFLRSACETLHQFEGTARVFL